MRGDRGWWLTTGHGFVRFVYPVVVNEAGEALALPVSVVRPATVAEAGLIEARTKEVRRDA